MGAYDTEHRRSLDDPASYWREQARAVDWFTRPRTVLDLGAPSVGQWYPDGVLNTCYNVLDRHVIRGRADEPALDFHSAYSGARRTYSYADLLQEVGQLGGGLRELGVQPGDRVLLLMPMVPEAVVALLACARLGAVHVLLPGGLAAAELAARIEDAQPKVVLVSSCALEPGQVVEYKPLLDAALEHSSHRPDYVVVHQRPEARAELHGERELELAVLMRPGQFQPAGCAELVATELFSIRYTPNATERPKGVVQNQGGHPVALAHLMRAVYGIGPEDVLVTGSDIGWGVGHALVYAPLLVGARTVLYEGEPGGTSDAGSFWQVVREHHGTVLVTTPTALRAAHRVDPDNALVRRHDLSSLRAVFVVGGRLEPGTARWVGEQLGAAAVDQWWPPETGLPIATAAADPATTSGPVWVPAPGYDVQVLGPDGVVLGPDREGALGLRLPLPPGALTTPWGREDRSGSDPDAPPGWYLTGDRGSVDANGHVVVRDSAADQVTAVDAS